jgi:hypothetical protein
MHQGDLFEVTSACGADAKVDPDLEPGDGALWRIEASGAERHDLAAGRGEGGEEQDPAPA